MESRDYLKDTIGDVESARHGHAKKEKVPRFKREGAGRILGLDSSLKIVQNGTSNEIAIGPGGRKRARYTDIFRDQYHKSQKTKSWSKKGSENLDLRQNVVLLSDETKRKKKDEETDQYLGYILADKNEKDSGEYKEDESSNEEDSDDGIWVGRDESVEKLKELDFQVRSNPSDVDSWLALVALQKDLMKVSQHQEKDSHNQRDGSHTKRHSDQSQLLAEVQFSVLERAIHEHPHNSASLPLIKAKLELAASSKAWNSSRIEKEWQETISSWSNDWKSSVDLWNEYLSWKIQDVDGFVLGDVLTAIGNAIKALNKFYYDQNHTKNREVLEKESIRLFSRAVDLMLDADFSEKARGVIQAQVELSSYLLENFTDLTAESFNLACLNLEKYWDRQEFRIGEVGYKSLSTFLQSEKNGINGKAAAADDSREFKTTIPIPEGLSDLDPIVRWITLEKARGQLRRWPAKWSEEADWQTGELEVDPFSFVLYSDIHNFLTPITTSSGLESLVKLLSDSVGVHFSSDTSYLIDSNRFWPLHLSECAQANKFEMIDGQLMSAPKRSLLSNPFRFPIKAWPEHLSTMYPFQRELSLPWFSLWDADFVEKKGASIARLIFQQVNPSSNKICMSHLGLLEVTQKHKLTTRLAKQLLGENRDEIELWRAYARLEKNNGNIETARVVYKSLLGIVNSKPSQDLISIWVDWAEMEWEAGEGASALSILILAIVSNFGNIEQATLTKITAASTIEVLRARRVVLAKISDYLTSSEAIFCIALFQYLSESQEEAFDSAMQIFNRAMNTVQDESKLELTAMAHCKFIWRHISEDSISRGSRSYVPKKITQILSTYVLQFKSNTAFVALLAAIEMKTQVENVLRNVLEKKIQLSEEATCQQDWLVYIYCELHMNLHNVNENAIRTLFERAVSSKSTSLSSTLWQMYLHFEVQISQRLLKSAQDARVRHEREADKNGFIKDNLRMDERRSKGALLKAKAVLYRAIGKVPYCKALYLTAFATPLRQVFSNDELLQLSHIMQEKDLRFFTNLDTFLGATKEESSCSSPFSESD